MTKLLRDQAIRLTRRLMAAFPDSGATDDTAALFVEKMIGLEADAAVRATERLVETSRRFPAVADLYEAYTASGGQLSDPLRAMSPAVGPPKPLPTPDERKQIAEMQKQIRTMVARLLDTAYDRSPDDSEQGRR